MNVFLETFLVLGYTFIFLWIINKWNFFQDSGISSTWLKGLFILKLGVGLVLYLIYTQFYTVRSEADIFRYFDDSLIVFNGIWKNPLDYLQLVFTKAPTTDYFYDNYYVKMNHWANPYNSIFYGDSILMIKVNAFFRLFSFGSFHVHSIFFNFLSFIGLVGIYRAFSSFVALRKEWLIGVVFCLPSVLFWSSSVLKESLLLLFMGLFCYHLRKNTSINIKSAIVMIISFVLLSLLKFYLAIVIVITFIAYLISRDYSRSLLTYTLITFVFSLLFFNTFLIDTLVLKQHDFLNLVSNTNAGSFYEIPILESNFISVLKAIPNGILNCFIQPFPNGNLSIMAFPAIIENLLILVGIGLVIPQLIKKENWKKEQLNGLLFMLFFIFILFSIIGITTPVAGALVRYKVAALPFLGIIILHFLKPRLNK